MKWIKNLWGRLTGYSACRNCGARFNWKKPESILTGFGSLVEPLCHDCFCELDKVWILGLVWKELQGDADDREFDPMVIDEKHPKFLGQIKTASDYIERQKSADNFLWAASSKTNQTIDRRKDDYNNSPGNNAITKCCDENVLGSSETPKG